jgi:hypothetical protein
MMHVAAEFGISGTGLAKICNRYAIPTPPRGYWAKLQNGKPTRQVPFIEIDNTKLDKLTIHAGAWHLPPEAQEVISRARAEHVRRSTPRPAVDAPIEPVVDVQPCIAATAKALRHAKPNRDGLVHATGDRTVGVTIGVNSIERAIFILDGLARALEARSLTPTACGTGVQAQRGPDKVALAMTERTQRVPHVATKEELAAEERRVKQRERFFASPRRWDLPAGSQPSHEKAYPDFDTVMTGQLVVQADGYGGDGVRRSWADGRMQRLERMIDDIAIGVDALLAVRTAKREEAEERQRQYAELARRRALAAKRVEREKKRVELLNALIELQSEADELGEWLTNGPLHDIVGEETATATARMLTWAEARLAKLGRRIAPDGIQKALEADGLFPEVDDLQDPLGDPPAGYNW